MKAVCWMLIVFCAASPNLAIGDSDEVIALSKLLPPHYFDTSNRFRRGFHLDMSRQLKMGKDDESYEDLKSKKNVFAIIKNRFTDILWQKHPDDASTKYDSKESVENYANDEISKESLENPDYDKDVEKNEVDEVEKFSEESLESPELNEDVEENEINKNDKFSEESLENPEPSEDVEENEVDGVEKFSEESLENTEFNEDVEKNEDDKVKESLEDPKSKEDVDKKYDDVVDTDQVSDKSLDDSESNEDVENSEDDKVSNESVKDLNSFTETKDICDLKNLVKELTLHLTLNALKPVQIYIPYAAFLLDFADKIAMKDIEIIIKECTVYDLLEPYIIKKGGKLQVIYNSDNILPISPPISSLNEMSKRDILIKLQNFNVAEKLLLPNISNIIKMAWNFLLGQVSKVEKNIGSKFIETSVQLKKFRLKRGLDVEDVTKYVSVIYEVVSKVWMKIEPLLRKYRSKRGVDVGDVTKYYFKSYEVLSELPFLRAINMIVNYLLTYLPESIKQLLLDGPYIDPTDSVPKYSPTEDYNNKEYNMPHNKEYDMPLKKDFDMPVYNGYEPHTEEYNMPLKKEYYMPFNNGHNMPLTEEYNMPHNKEYDIPLKKEYDMPLYNGYEPHTEEYKMPLKKEYNMPFNNGYNMPLTEYNMPPNKEYDMPLYNGYEPRTEEYNMPHKKEYNMPLVPLKEISPSKYLAPIPNIPIYQYPYADFIYVPAMIPMSLKK